jgi:epoxyqueuosine reductase
MSYMSRAVESRRDITRWFATARSVVVCAFSYHDGNETADLLPDQGRFARYCLPPDYHDILKERMARLLEHCRRLQPGCSGKVFVDTSPVMERRYARHAGIGWVGKNSMLIAPDAGSFLLLAGLALDLELEYDSPMPERCGKCERCLKTCPTKALVKPRVLDATRCIAYTTVELRKGAIPEPLRGAHGPWVFGCDACQDACPWNRFAKPGKALAPRMSAVQALSDLAGLTPETFSRRFQGTPIKRTGYTAFLRNVLLAMGASGDPRHRTALERFSRHPDRVLSEQARWSLARLESDKIRE